MLKLQEADICVSKCVRCYDIVMYTVTSGKICAYECNPGAFIMTGHQYWGVPRYTPSLEFQPLAKGLELGTRFTPMDQQDGIPRPLPDCAYYPLGTN